MIDRALKLSASPLRPTELRPNISEELNIGLLLCKLKNHSTEADVTNSIGFATEAK